MKMQKAYNTWTINIKYCVVFLIFTIIACTNHANIKHKGAYIDIEDKEIEVGALKKDATKHIYKVPILNSGDTPLEITEVLSSCYCASADMPKEPIQPGDTYQMEIVLDVSEMEIQDPFIREFYIKSNAVNGKELSSV